LGCNGLLAELLSATRCALRPEPIAEPILTDSEFALVLVAAEHGERNEPRAAGRGGEAAALQGP
jgi:hypothetical protein